MYRIVALLLLLFGSFAFAETQSGCWFLRPDAPELNLPANVKSVLIDQYFRVFYPADDATFVDGDQNGTPDIVEKQVPVFEKSRHLVETEMGWRLPASLREAGRTELNIYFIQMGRRFTGTVVRNPVPAIVLNRRVLNSSEFPAIWIHQFTHAIELQYRANGDFWFFEATAGWMEGQFQGYSTITQKAQAERLSHPEVSMLAVQPALALGASRYLELVARPVRDVIRQTWNQWSFAGETRADEILGSVLALNHLPDIESYLQNYYMLSTTDRFIDTESTDITLPPFSAVAFAGAPAQSAGGVRVSFVPAGETHYATDLLYFAVNEKSGTLALKKGLQGATSVALPYGGMARYRYILVNPNPSWLQGKLTAVFEPAIPGVLEYFRVNNEDGGVQIEWKTSREDGVAFWNLYRLAGGKKELLNDFPIPAAVQSDEGVHYMYFDSSDASFYSLEAITSEGFASPLATAESPQ